MFDSGLMRTIGLVQPAPLPGSYRHTGAPFKKILERALDEAKLLSDCGFDAIILQNMGDMPVKQLSRPEAIAFMSLIAYEIKKQVPVTLGILMNWDGVAALSVAEAAGADFVRVEHLYTGAEVTSAGILQAQCVEILELKKRMGSGIPILADVYEPHGAPIGRQDFGEAAWQAVHEAFADGLFLCGHSPEDSLDALRRARARVPNTPVFLGGGANGDNASMLAEQFDGVCVATWIKDGDMKNPVNPERAKYFVECAKAGGNKRHGND